MGHKEPLRPVLSSPRPTHGSMKTGISQNLEEGCNVLHRFLPHTQSLLWCADSEMISAVPFLVGMPSASGTAQVLQWVSVKRAGCWSPTGSQAESVKQLISVCVPVHLPSLTPHISLCFFSPHPSRVIYLTRLGVGKIQGFVFSGKRDVSTAEFWTLHTGRIKEGKCSPLPTNLRL